MFITQNSKDRLNGGFGCFLSMWLFNVFSYIYTIKSNVKELVQVSTRFASFLPGEGSQGPMTVVSPWKPMGAHKDAGEGIKKPLELEVPSDVMVLLWAG